MESSRYPNKPMLDFHGMPMFEHVYRRAEMVRVTKKVYVCTDSPEIIAHCKAKNISYIPTSTQPKNGTERIAEAINSLKTSDTDVIVNCQADDPLVSPYDLEALIKEHVEHPYVDVMLPHAIKDEAGDQLNANIMAGDDGKVMAISRNPIPSNYRSKMPYKKCLSIYSFRAEALEHYAVYGETDSEYNEGIETIRPVEMDMYVHTFQLGDLYQPVDVPEHYPIVWEALKKDQFTRKYLEIPED